MNDKKYVSFKERTLDEIWEEMDSLDGTALDEFLKEIDLDPTALVDSYQKSIVSAVHAKQRERFESAQRYVRSKKSPEKSKVISFDINRKRDILSAVQCRATKSGGMTVAARNQKLASDDDIDSLLEAYVRLGIIDADGNLKE